MAKNGMKIAKSTVRFLYQGECSLGLGGVGVGVGVGVGPGVGPGGVGPGGVGLGGVGSGVACPPTGLTVELDTCMLATVLLGANKVDRL